MFVAPSPRVSGPGYALARMFPEFAREAKLNGLFSSVMVPGGATIGEYHGEPTSAVGPYTMQLRSGRLIEPPESCVARYANFAGSAREANAEFVQRGERVYLVAKRAIRPKEEILTYMRHEPVSHPTSHVNEAHGHLARAVEYAKMHDSYKATRHAARAQERAREALLLIGRENDEAFGHAEFGARTKQTALKSTGGKAIKGAKKGPPEGTERMKKPHRDKYYSVLTTDANEGWDAFGGVPPLVNRWQLANDGNKDVIWNVDPKDPVHGHVSYAFDPLFMEKATRLKDIAVGDYDYHVLGKRELIENAKVYELERLADDKRFLGTREGTDKWRILSEEDERRYRDEEQAKQKEAVDRARSAATNASAGAKATGGRAPIRATDVEYYKVLVIGDNLGWAALRGVPPLVNRWKYDGSRQVIRNVDTTDPHHGRGSYAFDPRFMHKAARLNDIQVGSSKYKVLGKHELLTKLSTAEGDPLSVYELERDNTRYLGTVYIKRDGGKKEWTVLEADVEKRHRKAERERQKEAAARARSAPAGARATAQQAGGRYKIRTDAKRCNERWALLGGIPPLVNEWVRGTENGADVIMNVAPHDPVYGKAVYAFNSDVMKRISEKKKIEANGVTYTVLWRRDVMTNGEAKFAVYELEQAGKRTLAKLHKKSGKRGADRGLWELLSTEAEDAYRKAEEANQRKQGNANKSACQVMKLTRLK